MNTPNTDSRGAQIRTINYLEYEVLIATDAHNMQQMLNEHAKEGWNLHSWQAQSSPQAQFYELLFIMVKDHFYDRFSKEDVKETQA